MNTISFDLIWSNNAERHHLVLTPPETLVDCICRHFNASERDRDMMRIMKMTTPVDDVQLYCKYLTLVNNEVPIQDIQGEVFVMRAGTFWSDAHARTGVHETPGTFPWPK
eukprot:TRINITY_DN2698_c0_g1_i1.p1 TRINITY_DN2698_c0_g1~~TRINITY_DN2698_c0_g1_i1.p1  ORF type:complete len:110 (+),score=12.35 TRINITY_DN2698_c0_g1_i1:58-387(+)